MGVQADIDEQITVQLTEITRKRWTTPFKKTITEIEGYGSEVDVYSKSSLVGDGILHYT